MEGKPGRPMAPGEVGASLAKRLQDALPSGSHIAVCWLDGGAREVVASEGAPAPLAALAGGVLDDPSSLAAVEADPGRMALHWQGPGDSAVAVVAETQAALDPAAQHAWRVLGTGMLEDAAGLHRLRLRVRALEKSERLQQALYGIADLAGSDLELEEMLERIHQVVAGLMYAENFYIALYDDVEDSYRFLYFADRIDPFIADPDYVIRGADNPNSLTLALLRRGEPAQGPAALVREQLGVPADAANGPDSHDWLGVPMRRDERVCGAVVVQSYDRADSYGPEERALLAFVAQHILTALDRHQAREELERRVEERTQALQQSNRDLQAEIVERQRGERLQRALFRIAELSITSETLERFYAQVHDVVGELLYARNFYIAVRSQDGEHLEFPYSIDERDARRDSRRLGAGMTEYVLSTGAPILADRRRIQELEDAGLVRSHGTLSHCWLGVPLYREEAVVGVIAVQSYSPAISFTRRDQELLTFVAHHIGIGLMRKQSQDRLVAAHAKLEHRVEERTGELARANAELLEQIGERLRAEQRLTHQARHDALTGLPNRQQLLDRLTEAITVARSARLAAGGKPAPGFAVLFLDLDRFKLVNDSVGHSAGDELLVEAGRRIVGAMREGDTVARLGGDEFAILVEGIDGLEMAEELAQRVLIALGRPCWVAGREVFPSASLGIAMWHPRYRSGAELLRDADAAMYRAKAAGRDRCAVFDEDMREEAMRILDLEADLRRAINSDSFVPFYQPIVRLSDGEVIGHEALLRWRHPTRGLLSPGEFIGLGEDSGLIEEVDWLMYAQVISRLSTVGTGYISVNVSPRHFRSPDFADRLLRLVHTAGADPSRLRIEITEVALLDDAPRAVHTLSVLREHGVMAQLDDFGTGYSALSYLHRFPIECLKIDQSFVAGLIGPNRHESIAVVRAIQALAGTLGIHTVGEGVETPEQLEALLELGCGYGQGYLLGRPAEAMASRADAVSA
ncbi:EAL domain-containing protein [Novilysobacter defluvii]|uniref:EAL domain-containing protein n=1 Tax=Novilysobacter defluvii TaxID=391738 RepID=UPI00068EAAE0|nr:EAL domain-containing protein [Lysobacter defluvii]